MIGFWSRVRAGLDTHGKLAMVTVAATRGSVPRETGARLLVTADGSFTGTVGGGSLEWRAIALAQAALASSRAPRAEVRTFALGPELGQCCGGQVRLLVELIARPESAMVDALAAREAKGPFSTRGIVSAESGVRREIVSVETAGVDGTILSGDVLIERFGDDRRSVLLFGAGHVGRALALALAPLPFAVTWVDPRPDAFPAYLPGNATAVHLENPVEALQAGDGASLVLVMSHSHALDLAIVRAALAEDRFAYVGLIGSATKRARFEKRLLETGIGRPALARLVCPIGVDGIRSKHPAAIAAATVAELLIKDEELRSADLPAGADTVLAGLQGRMG